MDRVSPEGEDVEGREGEAACRGASLAKHRPEEATGRAVQHCTSPLFLSIF